MKIVLKAIVKTVKWTFIVFCLFLGSLCFRQQRLPGEWVERLCGELSSDRLVVACDSASVGFVDGIHFANLRVYDPSRRDKLKPVFSADSLSVWLLSRHVRLVAAKLPRLHDGYYGYESGVRTGSSGEGEGGFDLAAFRFPELPSFTLELVRPEILGVAPEGVTARVECTPRKLDFRAIHLDWPDQDFKMWVDGFCTVDLDAPQVVGEVSGTARQEHIRPLLVALDLPVSYPYMGGYPDTGTSGFTEVVGPVPAYCGWKADLATKEFNLDLDLHPVMGRYNNVRLQRADGKLGVHVYFTDRYMGYDITVGPLTALDPKGRTFGGKLVVHGTNWLDYLEFDAHSELAKQDTLDIIGYLNRGLLDDFVCDTPARVTAKGVFNCDDVNIANNDLGGTIEVDRGKVFGQPFNGLKMQYRLKGSEISFTGISAHGVSGSDLAGGMSFHVPLADGDERFDGGGSVVLKNGELLQIPMFWVLTEALAKNVPGFAKLVTQSEARCDFVIEDGRFKTDNLVIEGALFSLRLKGSYDFATEDLDFIAHCTVMKEESALGRYFIQPVLWPFTKLLTEFHVTGKAGSPELRNTSVKSLSEKAGEWKSKAGDITERAGRIIGKPGEFLKETFIQ